MNNTQIKNYLNMLIEISTRWLDALKVSKIGHICIDLHRTYSNANLFLNIFL